MKKYLFVSFLFLLLSASACKRTVSPGVDTNKPNDTAADQSDPKAKAEFLQAARKFTELPFASAKVDWTKSIDGKEFANSALIQYAAPNRYRTKWLIKLGEPDEIEYVGMGKMVWAKTCWRCPDGGKWAKISEDGGTSNLKDLFAQESLKRLADVKHDGEEVIDGKKTYVYSYKNQVFRPIVDAVDYMTVSSCKIWVLQDKGVPVKLRADFSDSPVRSLDVVFDLEKPVKIEAPAVSD